MIFRRSEHRDLGEEGERLAAQFLRRRGYRVLERNYRTRNGEIDIICEYRGSIVFVEVKTRTNLAFGQPEEAVDARKQKKMVEMARSYLSQKSLSGKIDCRFDVVAILDGTRRSVKHIEDAFRV